MKKRVLIQRNPQSTANPLHDLLVGEHVRELVGGGHAEQQTMMGSTILSAC